MLLILVIVFKYPYRFKSVFNRSHQPQKRRLITQEEYVEESKWATAKAMEDLRAYCSSPECNTWRVVSRLKDPKKYEIFCIHFRLNRPSLFIHIHCTFLAVFLCDCGIFWQFSLQLHNKLYASLKVCNIYGDWETD